MRRPITIDNCAVLFMDLCEGPLAWVSSMDRHALRLNAGALARAVALLQLPTILAQAAIPGPAGEFLEEVAAALPSAVRVAHSTNNSWESEAFCQAVQATGRTHLVMAGIATDVGLALTALSAVEAGFQVYAVIDVAGTFSASAEQAAWLRMNQGGVQLTSWAAILGELQKDYTTGRGVQLRGIIGQRFGQVSLAEATEPEKADRQMDQVRAEQLVARIHQVDHQLDLEGFLSLLDPDVQLRLGSQPPLQGRGAVRSVIAGLFAQLAGIQHRLIALSQQQHTITFEAEVTYTLPDQNRITVPYVDVLRLGDDGLIQDYRIYIDLAPLFGALGQLQKGA